MNKNPSTSCSIIPYHTCAVTVYKFNGSPRLKAGDFNLKLHPKPRKEVPNV